jgi:hypothetical protein
VGKTGVAIAVERRSTKPKELRVAIRAVLERAAKTLATGLGGGRIRNA